ncbi:hypothetical protein J3F83DRAFT_751310, partial [Trichoderma novae-zelandiae]
MKRGGDDKKRHFFCRVSIFFFSLSGGVSTIGLIAMQPQALIFFLILFLSVHLHGSTVGSWAPAV